MSKLHDEIVNLEAILENDHGERDPKELQAMEEDLARFRYVEALWDAFSAIPKTDGKIQAEFTPYGPDGLPLPEGPAFPAGCAESAVLSWFGKHFCVDPREDLGYDGPWGLPADAGRPQKEYTVCLLFNRGLSTVLLQRKRKTDYAGKLNGTGGKLEPGETPEQCARREIREETGLSGLDPFLWLGTLSLPFNCDNHAASVAPDDPACVLHYYAGIIPDEAVPAAPEDGEALVPVPLSQILSANTNDPRFAGDGDLQYFARKAADMLGKVLRKEDGTWS